GSLDLRGGVCAGALRSSGRDARGQEHESREGYDPDVRHRSVLPQWRISPLRRARRQNETLAVQRRGPLELVGRCTTNLRQSNKVSLNRPSGVKGGCPMRMRPQDWHAIAKGLGVRHTEPLSRPLLTCLPASIVAGGGCHVGMARELIITLMFTS